MSVMRAIMIAVLASGLCSGCDRAFVMEGKPNLLRAATRPVDDDFLLHFDGYYEAADDHVQVVLRRDGKGQLAFQRTTIILSLLNQDGDKGSYRFESGELISTIGIPPHTIDDVYYLHGDSFEVKSVHGGALLVMYDGLIDHVANSDVVSDQEWLRFCVKANHDNTMAETSIAAVSSLHGAAGE